MNTINDIKEFLQTRNIEPNEQIIKKYMLSYALYASNDIEKFIEHIDVTDFMNWLKDEIGEKGINKNYISAIEAYLTLRGATYSHDDVNKLIDIYENEQEWNEGVMTTGNSIDEILTWVKEKVDYMKVNNIESFDEFFDSLEHNEIERD